MNVFVTAVILIVGFRADKVVCALIALLIPTRSSVWMIWRWRLDDSTLSESIIVMLPMPDAAK